MPRIGILNLRAYKKFGGPLLSTWTAIEMMVRGISFRVLESPLSCASSPDGQGLRRELRGLKGHGLTPKKTPFCTGHLPLKHIKSKFLNNSDFKLKTHHPIQNISRMSIFAKKDLLMYESVRRSQIRMCIFTLALTTLHSVLSLKKI